VLALIVAALRGEGDAVRQGIDTLFTREDGHAQPERVRHWHHQVANFAVRLVAALDGDAAELRHWIARLMPVPEGGPPSPREARLAAAEGRWAAAAEAYVALLPHVERLDLMGQAVELHLRAGHALLRCDRAPEAARTLRPGLARIRAEGVPGHALMAGPTVLAELAAARWGGTLDAAEQALLHELVAMSAALRGAVAPAAEARGETQPGAAPGVAAADADALLSAREREVLECMAAGDSNKLIARRLDISPHTVKRHVANILDKLALSSRGQAAAWLRDRR
jgi:LuxR family maltose regulon positive regulatory protein